MTSVRGKKAVSQYKRIGKELEDQDFPPIGQITYQSTNDPSAMHDAHVSVESIPLEGAVVVTQ